MTRVDLLYLMNFNNDSNFLGINRTNIGSFLYMRSLYNCSRGLSVKWDIAQFPIEYGEGALNKVLSSPDSYEYLDEWGLKGGLRNPNVVGLEEINEFGSKIYFFGGEVKTYEDWRKDPTIDREQLDSSFKILTTSPDTDFLIRKEILSSNLFETMSKDFITPIPPGQNYEIIKNPLWKVI